MNRTRALTCGFLGELLGESGSSTRNSDLAPVSQASDPIRPRARQDHEACRFVRYVADQETNHEHALLPNRPSSPVPSKPNHVDHEVLALLNRYRRGNNLVINIGGGRIAGSRHHLS
jgi:hypothetical protein